MNDQNLSFDFDKMYPVFNITSNFQNTLDLTNLQNISLRINEIYSGFKIPKTYQAIQNAVNTPLNSIKHYTENNSTIQNIINSDYYLEAINIIAKMNQLYTNINPPIEILTNNLNEIFTFMESYESLIKKLSVYSSMPELDFENIISFKDLEFIDEQNGFSDNKSQIEISALKSEIDQLNDRIENLEENSTENKKESGLRKYLYETYIKAGFPKLFVDYLFGKIVDVGFKGIVCLIFFLSIYIFSSLGLAKPEYVYQYNVENVDNLPIELLTVKNNQDLKVLKKFYQDNLIIEAKNSRIVTKDMYVHSNHSRESARISTVEMGEYVISLETAKRRDWSKIIFHDYVINEYYTGWVFTRYLDKLD